MKTVYAFLADGMEEVEALMVIDLLRRTKKLNVVTVSVKDDLLVESSHKIKLFADKNINEIDFEKEIAFSFREEYRGHLILQLVRD